MIPDCPATNFSESFFIETGDKFCLFNKPENVIQMPNMTCINDTMIIGCSSLHNYAVQVSLTTFLKGNQKNETLFLTKTYLSFGVFDGQKICFVQIIFGETFFFDQ